jgi:hypothetical protein
MVSITRTSEQKTIYTQTASSNYWHLERS